MSTVVGLLAASLAVAPAPAEESAWIVETAPGAVEVVAEAAEQLGGSETETFDDAFTGVAVELTDAEAGMLEQRSDVVAVHPDVEMTLFDTQSSAPWHLSRLDQATAPADSTYTYPTSAGAGVRVYVVDTGIAPNAGQLGSRLLPGVSVLAGDPSTVDCQGHGTHVAGIVASTTYGVAKKASVVPVRVFSCSGSTSSSTVISGLDWIAANHPAGTPGVVNMSLGGGVSSALDSAVQRLITRGFIVTVAAGNGGSDQVGDDACTQSPARVTGALTVGATTSTDARAGYSNFGSCLDLFAPGSAVRSLSYSNASSYVTMSGTSMATPVVAGVAAAVWGASPSSTARQVESAVLSLTRRGVVTNPGAGSPNSLAATPPVAAPAPAPAPATKLGSPTITAPASGAPYSSTQPLTISGTAPGAAVGTAITARWGSNSSLRSSVDSSGRWTLTLPTTAASSAALAVEISVGADQARTLLLGTPTAGLRAATVTRIQGDDRYSTAVALTRSRFAPGGLDGPLFVVIGSNYPDALAAAPVATQLGGAVLLTRGDRVPTAVRDEIRRLAPPRIVIVGGPKVIGSAVESDLRTLAPVSRIAGASRYETAAALAELGFPAGSASVVVATGSDFPDALAAGAAGAASGYPVVLAPGRDARLPASVVSSIDGSGADNASAIGGSSVLSDGILTDIRRVVPASRIAGADRYTTAALTARIAHPAGTQADRVLLATGGDFPDALAAGSIAGTGGDPLLLVRGTCVPTSVLTALASYGPSSIQLVGGSGVLSTALQRLTMCP